MEKIKIINDNGRPWVIVTGAIGELGALVSFFDGRYEHTDYGQFVSSYYIETLLETDGGLDLCGHEPSWKISASAMNRIRKYLTAI